MVISKEDLKQRLRTLYQAKGLKDSALDRLTEIVFPRFTEQSTEDEDTAVIDGLSPYVDMLQSEVERVRTSRVQTGQNKEPKTGEQKQGAVTTANYQNQNDNNDQEAPQWATAIISRLDKLEGEKIVGGRKSQLDNVLEGLSDVQKKAYSRIRLEDYSDEDFSTELEAIKTEAEELRTQNNTKGVVTTPPRASNNPAPKAAAGKEVEALVDSFKI